MRIDIEAVGEKKWNYKKVILIIAIIVASIACVYIGIILPKLVNITPMVSTGKNIDTQQVVADGRKENVIADIDLEIKEGPSREDAEKEYPVIKSEGIAKIKDIYNSTYKRVYLTFDDGPSKTVTTQILSILDNYNVKATFFVLGSRVDLYPDIVKEAYTKGHYIANHGYSHKYSYIYETIDNVMGEYRSTENAIKNALGMPEYCSNVFRFPGGSQGGKYADLKAQAITALENNNIAQLDWNCLTRDSEGKFTKEELVQNMINTAQEKDSVVILMHDAGDKITTYEALPEIIEYFKNNGYVFETMYDLI